MWIVLAIISAVGLGFYDVFKKISLRDNNVLIVLLLNTVFCTLLLSPVLITDLSSGTIGLDGTLRAHGHILLKAVIVLSSWILGYFSIKNLPLTIAGPINAARPVIVLVGALLIFGERLNLLQWIGVAMGFWSLLFISLVGAKERTARSNTRWLLMAVGATTLGAVSALYDKFLMRLYTPLEVQAWYTLYQVIIMSLIIVVLRRFTPVDANTPFRWRWTIPLISLFLTGADLAYFYALSLPDSLIAIVSMLRRGAVVVSFIYGALVLHEKHLRLKTIDLCVLLAALTLLVIGS